MFPVVSGNGSKADLSLPLPGSQDTSGNVSPFVACGTSNPQYSKTVCLLATGPHLFLGAFREILRKATISCVSLACLHGTTSLPPEILASNIDFTDFY